MRRIGATRGEKPIDRLNPAENHDLNEIADKAAESRDTEYLPGGDGVVATRYIRADTAMMIGLRFPQSKPSTVDRGWLDVTATLLARGVRNGTALAKILNCADATAYALIDAVRERQAMPQSEVMAQVRRAAAAERFDEIGATAWQEATSGLDAATRVRALKTALEAYTKAAELDGLLSAKQAAATDTPAAGGELPLGVAELRARFGLDGAQVAALGRQLAKAMSAQDTEALRLDKAAEAEEIAAAKGS